MRRLLILLIGLTSLIFSCKAKKGITNDTATIADTVYVENPETGEITMVITNKNASAKGFWILQSIDGEHDDEMRRVNLQIGTKKSEKTYGGNDGCNSYTGQIKIHDNEQIEFGPAASTKRACFVPAKHAKALYEKLPQIKKYRVSTNHLFLYDADGKTSMRFVKKK